MLPMRFTGLFLLLAFFGMGCDAGRSEPEAHHQPDSPPAVSESDSNSSSDMEFYDARGTFLWSEPGRVYLNHEEIPGFMDAMAMGYPVQDPSIVEGLEQGTTVLFRVVLESDGSFYVDQITPESTE